MRYLASLLCFFSIAVSVVCGTSVLFPLYAYPGAGGKEWARFYTALEQHPSLTFRAILNPNSGPTSAPDDAYTAGIQRLRKYRNVVILGYVSTGYGTKNATRIEADVNTWASWPSSVRPSGIFFDEAEKGEVPGSWATLQKVNTAARTKGVGSVPINNVGTVPVNETVFDYANETVIYENSWPNYRTAVPGIDKIKAPAKGLGIMIYCMPDYDMYWQVRKYSRRGYGSMFLTDGGTFKQFYPYFETFIGSMNRFNGHQIDNDELK